MNRPALFARSRGAATATALLLAGCSAPARGGSAASPSFTAPAVVDALAFHVEPRATPPASFAADGDTSEWEERSREVGGAAPPSLDDPGSFAVALNERGLALAGHLPDGVEAIRIELQFAVPDLPTVGSMTRTGEIRPPQCEIDLATGEPLPADVRWRCEAPNRARDALAETFATRFRRAYVLRAGGRIVDAASADDVAPVAWSAARSSQPRGTRFEAIIPPGELPMVATAPVDGARVDIAPIGRGASSMRGAAAEIAPASPISFGPGGAVRARLFQVMELMPLWRPVVFYSPAGGNTVHHVGYAPGSGTSELEIADKQLVVPIGTVGDLTVADVFVGQPALGLLRGEEMIDVLTFESRDREVPPEKRGRGLHVYDIDDVEHENGCRTIRPHILEIRADATSEDVADAEVGPTEARPCWRSATVQVNRGFTEITVAGEASRMDEQHARRLSVTWRYDARSGRYVVVAR